MAADTMARQPVNYAASGQDESTTSQGQVSQSMRDVVDEKYRDLRKPRRARFFCNGDRYFKGKILSITPHRYTSLKDLLTDLTQKLPGGAHLPYGVRKVYFSESGNRLTSLEQLEDGGNYVCAGFDNFKPIKYGSESMEPWSFGKQAERYQDFESDFDYRYRPNYGGAGGPNLSRGFFGHGGFAPGKTLRHTYPRRYPNGTTARPGAGYIQHSESSPIKPKVITVVRAGNRPRKKVTILLNRRSVQSFEQLIADVSEALGAPRWKNNRVRKLYTLKGKDVQGVSDFFRDDDVFIAAGLEHIAQDQVVDILEDLYPDNPYAKNLAKEWEKSRKKRKPRGYNAPGRNKDGSTDHNGDSGYGGDGDSSQDGEEAGKIKSRPKRYENFRSSKPAAYPTTQGEDAKLENDRRGAEEQRAARRAQKMKEAERRAEEEEKRKRGLVQVIRPAEDPFKKMNDRAKEKERERKRKEEEERKRKEEDERKARDDREEKEREEERRRKEEDDEKRRKAEAAARKRMDEADKKDKDKDKAKDDKKEDDKEEKKEKPAAEDKPRDKKTRAQVMKENKVRRQVADNGPVLEKYDMGRVLGDGNFAIVKDARLKKMSNMTYAIKIIDKSKMKGKEHMIENEIQIMKDCNHPNICRLYEEYETSTEIYLVMELVKGGDLFDSITQSIKFSEYEAAFMVRDLGQALFYLHSRRIVHRDMKPENLLVVRNKDQTISLKLADFGLAMEVHEPIFTVCGTPTYVAPEILQETGYGLEVDMWALGVITYILLCGFPPFRSPDRNQTELFEFIKAGDFEYLRPYWDNISDSAKDLIDHLLVVDKKKRYSSIDLLCHPWIVSLGGTQELPDNLTDFRRALRLDLERQARTGYKEYHDIYRRKTVVPD